ncbi:hypothetical protein [Clostridium tagluense]|uniref:hypothetical protein n=1 Tax=Clostridium tagluense TaxID=360422 RepID=UPI001C6F47CF|nr:hypothetical protein [Clostridium tagluense]MBW9156979.1 hypothetical protein [Clostridium tagluense]WLC64966.1 hypothetical protein KTC93_19320 [Clostridium tagluense]
MDKETKQMFELVLAKLDSMERKQDSMERKQDSMDKRQDEVYIMQRGLEENAKVTRAEQDKMMHILSDIQGKVTKLTGEVEEHENFISQIRSIK